MGRRGFLASAGTVVAGTLAGCTESEYEQYDLSKVEETGLNELVGEQIELHGYVEKTGEPAYFLHRDQDGNRELVEPQNGVFRIYENQTPDTSEYSVPILHSHVEHDLPRSRDDGEHRVPGHVIKYYLDEDAEEEAYGLYFDTAYKA